MVREDSRWNHDLVGGVSGLTDQCRGYRRKKGGGGGGNQREGEVRMRGLIVDIIEFAVSVSHREKEMTIKD